MPSDRLNKKQLGLSFIAGALFYFAYAPYSLIGVALISLAVLFSFVHGSIKQSSANGYSFGLGYFGFGVSWLYLCVHDYGQLAWYLAMPITLALIAFLALYIAGFAAIYAYLFRHRTTLPRLIGFSCLWALSEWGRSHVLLGLPWLISGYIHTAPPLAVLAPILGVYGLSALTALCSGLLCMGLMPAPQPARHPYFLLGSLMLIFILPSLLLPTHWTTPSSKQLTVRLIQANISPHDKWTDDYFNQLFEHYLALSFKQPQADLIIWPESALPVTLQTIEEKLTALDKRLFAQHSALIFGAFNEQFHHGDFHYYNTFNVLGDGEGHYNKQHLVPLGEYSPYLALSKVFDYLSLPLPIFSPGQIHQAIPLIKGVPIAPFICYDLAFSDSLLSALPKAELLISITDDSWFGHSSALAQHRQMARFRSLQSGRPQLFASNNGLSSLIDSKGNVTQQAKAYQAQTLDIQVQGYQGLTPWARFGDQGIILCLLVLLLSAASPWRKLYDFAKKHDAICRDEKD